MTDLAKAIAFATQCLGYRYASACGKVVRETASDRAFAADSASDLERVLQQFLGTRYFIQVNRGTSSLFYWRAIIGLQDLSSKGAPFDHAQAEGEDLWNCIFDACVEAAKMHRKAPGA